MIHEDMLLRKADNPQIFKVLEQIDPILDEIDLVHGSTIIDEINNSRAVMPFKVKTIHTFGYFDEAALPAGRSPFRQWLEQTARGVFRRPIEGLTPPWQYWCLPCGSIELSATTEDLKNLLDSDEQWLRQRAIEWLQKDSYKGAFTAHAILSFDVGNDKTPLDIRLSRWSGNY